VRRLAAILGAVVAVLVAAVVILVLVWDWGWFRDTAQTRASAVTGRSVTFDRLDVAWDWSTPEVTLEGVTFGNAEWASAPNMLEADTIRFRIEIWESIFGNYVLPELTLVRPVASLEKSDDGTANWAMGGNLAGDAALETVPEDRGDMPQIGRLVVEDGELAYIDPARGIDLTSRIATATGDTDDRRIELDGEGRFEGRPFRLVFSGGSLLSLRQPDEPYPVDVDATIGATSLRAQGTVTEPFDLCGLDLTLELAGPDMAEIFPIFGIPLPSTPPYSLAGNLERDGENWAFRGFSGTVGDSDLAGDVTIEPGETRALLTADLVSERLDFDALAGFIGAEPATGEGETASAAQQEAATAEVAKSGILPDTPVDLERLRAMDMDVHYRATHIQAPGYALEEMDAVLTLRDGLAVLDPLRFDIADGSITGRLELDGRSDTPNARADLGIEEVFVRRFFSGSVFADEMGGTLFGHIDLAGAGASLADMLAASDGRLAVVALDGTISAVVVELIGLDIAESLSLAVVGDDPALSIDCAAADFEVVGGVAMSKTLLLDNTDSLIVGEGTIRLADETLDVTVMAEPKDFSLLSLNAPVFVRGSFKEPAYGIGPEALIPKIDMGGGDDLPDHCAKLREAL
jgi:AsmA family protein